jgi:glycosyltransferase involved in cell wall biosynthesis
MKGKMNVNTPKFTKNDVVRYVLLGSSRGLYGGPFDTTLAQHRLVPFYFEHVVAGYFQGDMPKSRGEAVYYHRVRHIFGRNDFFDVSSFEQIVSLWRVAGAGLVHISFARGIGPMVLLLFCHLRKAKVVLQTHGMITSRRSRLHTLLDVSLTRRLIPSDCLVIALTEVEERQLLFWHPKLARRIRIVGNPVLTTDANHSVSEGNETAIFIGRLHARKDVMSFAEASRISELKGWPEKYLVLGPDEGDLEALLHKTSNQKNFEYVGSTNKEGVIERLRACGVFVLTSKDEPWGNVLATAIFIGKPIVLTASSALAGVVESYNAGIVVTDGDANGIADAVHKLLEAKNYEFYSQNAKYCGAMEFSNEKIIKKWLDILEETGFSSTKIGQMK